MKIKYILLLIVLWNVGLVSGQSTTTTPTPDKSFLPNFTPPSPESFAITEYGKNAVNEFSGKVNLSIPVYNYKIGNLTLPVSINYSGAGVKVNDASTIVGTNWVLNSGGVINRKINDLADEATSTIRVFIDYQQMKTNTEENCHPYSQDFIDLAKNPWKDSEIDEWSFNFNGYSGSFYLDQDFNPIYTENESELKIQIIGNGSTNLEKLRNSHTFLITTPDGAKYYFGGLETERTMVFSGHRGSSFMENTSFYLYKIEDNLNNEINLEYYTDQGALLKYGQSYQLLPVPELTESNIPGFTTTIMQNQIENPKYLKKIKNNKNTDEVLFNIATYNNYHYLASLQNIEVYSNSTLIKKVELSYDFPDNLTFTNPITAPATRFFLNKVEINKALLNVNGKYEVYKFEYDNINQMPERFSPRQDILGFFNNKNNQTTIPKPEFFHNVASPSFGDLNPDFDYAKKGSLTKVIYPTGGFSTFEYEPTKALVKKYKLYQRNISGDTIAHIPSYNELTDEMEYFTPVYSDQKVKIEIFTGFSQSSNPTENTLLYYQAYHNLKVQLTITDITANTAPVVIQRSLGMQAGMTQHDMDHFIAGHVYTVEFKFLINNIQNYPYINFINAYFRIKLFDGYNVVNGFGVRIKSQQDYSSNNMSSNYKRYYYKNINELNNENYGLSEINFTPKFTFTFANNTNNFLGYNINVYSESNIYSNKNIFETYDVVTTSEGGDDFENGGTEKYFLKRQNERNTKLITSYDGCWLQPDPEGNNPNDVGASYVLCGAPNEKNTGITLVRNMAYTNETTKLDGFNGKLLAERNFIKKNNSIYKNREVLYDYSINRKHLNNAVNYVTWDLFGQQLPLNWCPDNPSVPIFPLSAYFKAYYFIETFENTLNGITTKEYIDPVPLSQNIPYFTGFEQDVDPNYSLHDLNFRKIVTTQNNSYGTLRGLPTETTTTTSDDNRILTTKNYYPNDASELNGLTTDQVNVCDTLVSQNRLATPIQVESYENHDLLSTQRTLYKAWNSNAQQVLPEIIQTSKGDNPLEDRAVFSEYDANGNPTVVSLKDGTKTKYFYNALNQVVAKVENYSASLNIPTQPNLSNACAFITQYPQAQISVYNYDATTHQIVSIVAPNCKTMYYVYNALHQLQAIKDNDGNIVQEFEHNYKPQN